MQSARKITQPKVKLTPFPQEVDFCVLKTFDLALVHHTDNALLQALQDRCPQAIYSLEQNILLERMIYSPYAVILTPIAVDILYKHMSESYDYQKKPSLLALLDYTDLEERYSQTSLSGKDYLPTKTEVALKTPNRVFNAEKTTTQLAKNQVVSVAGVRKHLRYYDPYVFVHMVALGHIRYVANRFSHPTRMWLQYDKCWYILDNIDVYTQPDNMHRLEKTPSFCSLSANELENINILNAFFVQNGIKNTLDLVIQDYKHLQTWVEQAKNDPMLDTIDNPVSRDVIIYDSLYDSYQTHMNI